MNPSTEPTSRRRFLASVVVTLNAVTGLLVAVPAVGFLLGPLRRRRPPAWISLGPTSDFGGDSPVRVDFAVPDESGFGGTRVRHTAFVRRTAGGFLVLSSRCTHMGCTVSFRAERTSFDCPCHGGRYDLTGDVIEGPPPRPLDRYPVRLTAGNLEIET